MATQAGKTDDDIGRVLRLDLVEDALVDNAAHDLFHIVGLVRAVGHDRVEFRVGAQRIILARQERRVFHVVLGQVAEHLAHEQQRLRLVFADDMADAAAHRVDGCAAQLLEGDILMRHRLDDLWPGDEHIAGVFDHEDEIGQRRAVDRAACARPHDDADLRDDAAGERIAQEDIGVAGQAPDALLDARAAAVVETDDWRAGLHRHFHDLADLLRVDFAQRAADDGEILRIDVYEPTVDRPPAGDHAVAERTLAIHAEVACAVGDEGIDLVKAARIAQDIETLARCVAPALMLAADAFLTAAFLALFAQRP